MLFFLKRNMNRFCCIEPGSLGCYVNSCGAERQVCATGTSDCQVKKSRTVRPKRWQRPNSKRRKIQSIKGNIPKIRRSNKIRKWEFYVSGRIPCYPAKPSGKEKAKFPRSQGKILFLGEISPQRSRNYRQIINWSRRGWRRWAKAKPPPTSAPPLSTFLLRLKVVIRNKW